ncbi:MAG: hypothetical protein ABSF21_00920 [Dehalococcoidia bacterium]
MNGDCQRCKDYRLCIPPEWFNYAEIRFCPYQVVWIISCATTLRAGRWPQDPDNSSDNVGQRNIKTEASFTKPILILAEVEFRLRRTGIHGKLLVAQIEAGRGLETLDAEARDALMYVKGWRQKDMPFNAWLKQRIYRRNDYQKVVKMVT